MGYGSLVTLQAQRQTLPLNDGWEFQFANEVRPKAPRTAVTLPHTWNAGEVFTKGIDYTRTSGLYTRRWTVPAEWQGQRVFLRFEGVNSVAHVFVNQKLVGQHAGGYTAFCLELTDALDFGKENLLTVQASNAHRLDVLPMSGDFNVYGGIHRPVSVLVTPKNCITPLDFASPGVYVRQSDVSEKAATVAVQTKLSLNAPAKTLRVKTTITDAAGTPVAEKIVAATSTEVRPSFTISNPHLWNAQADPYQYRVRVQLLDGTRILDEITQPLGLRSYRVDPDRGFFLNGRYLDLRGVCRHQDVQGKGSALTPADHERDLELIQEIGATALRLTHYPHNTEFYDGCDRAGLVVWTEIPMVGPGGYNGPGYVKNPALHAHARQVLTELIRQNFNHPSICFWGLHNELKLDYDDPQPFLAELNALAHAEDPSRPTTLATFLDNKAYSTVSDVMAWNKYFGWYGGRNEQMGTWADDIHQLLPAKPIGVSEYGAGGSIRQHDDTLRPAVPTSRWHPEGWQAHYHEGNWAELSKRPFVWGKFIWVLADFGSSIRTEGDTVGINDKGLVTYDRQTKKDAFYFYKANWNPAPSLYLADQRHTRRKVAVTTVKVYANLPEVELLVNGRSLGKRQPDDLKIVRFEGVTLQPGRNEVRIRGTANGQTLEDRAEWTLVVPAASQAPAFVPNYDEAQVGTYTLPDPLVGASGRRITKAKDWERSRRAEVLDLFKKHVYGELPGRPAGLRFRVRRVDSSLFGGKALRKFVRISFGEAPDAPGMDVMLVVPKSRKPVPVFVTLNYGNHTTSPDSTIPLPTRPGLTPDGQPIPRGAATRRWPFEQLVDAGFGIAMADYADLEPDRRTGWQTGIRTTLQGQTGLKPEQWSALGAWAWGMSRILDYLETDPLVDAKQVLVQGHSRLGKAALWAGANDPRFALVISNESGEGGAALARRNYGETIGRITTVFPHWFIPAYAGYAERIPELPVDQHELLALIAPRPLYVTSAEEDRWSDPRGEFLSAVAAAPVWALYGKAGLGTDQYPTPNQPIHGPTLGYHVRTGVHDVTPFDWAQYIAFAKKMGIRN